MRSRWAGLSTISVMAAASCSGPWPARASAARSAVGYATSTSSRDAGADQPDRLGQGVRHDAVPAGPGQHPFEQRAAAHRLAGDPDRLAAGAGGQRGGVGVEGGQVDDRERRLEVRRWRGRGARCRSRCVRAITRSTISPSPMQCETPSSMRPPGTCGVTRSSCATARLQCSGAVSHGRYGHRHRSERGAHADAAPPVDLSGVAALRSRPAHPAVPPALAGARRRLARRLARPAGHRDLRRRSRSTGSARRARAFGGVIAVRLLPALVLGPIAGVFADRFDRRYTMVICDLIRFVVLRLDPGRRAVQRLRRGSSSPGPPSPPSSSRRSR